MINLIFRSLIIFIALAIQSCGVPNEHTKGEIQFIELDDQYKFFYMTDPLYPSNPEYEEWVSLIQETIEKQLSGSDLSFLIWGGDNLAIDRSFDWQIYKQKRMLRKAMDSASNESAFVSGNHDYNQIRALIFNGTDTIKKFDGNRNRVVLSQDLALFLYDAYFFESNNYSYDNPNINPEQLTAYESKVNDICMTRKCVGVIGTQYLNHDTLQAHWQTMHANGLQLLVTGDSHESRYSQLNINNNSHLPIVELSPSGGAKLPSKIDFSGRPSAIFELTVSSNILKLRKIYLNDKVDTAFRSDGFCSKQDSLLSNEIEIDFLLDNHPCAFTNVTHNPTPYPIAIATFGERYSVFGFDINFDFFENIIVSNDDLQKGVILYASSKADSNYKTHGFRLSMKNNKVTMTLLDRWLRVTGSEQDIFEYDRLKCPISISRNGIDILYVESCEESTQVKLKLTSGVFFGAKGNGEYGSLKSKLNLRNPKRYPNFQ